MMPMQNFCAYMILYVALMLLPLQAVARQRVWQHVTTFRAPQTVYQVTGVTVNDTATLVSLTAKGTSATSFFIRPSCHLRDAQGRVYALLSSEGVTLGRDVWLDERGRLDFVLAFAPLPDEVRMVDFVESEIHREQVIMLGIAEEGAVDAARYRQRPLSQWLTCTHSYGKEKAHLHGKLRGYNPRRDHASLFLCDESALVDDTRRPLASCHIQTDGTFSLQVPVDKPALMVLTSAQEGAAWQIPVFLHPADQVHLTIDLGAGRVVGYQSKCPVNHLVAMQDVAVLGSEICVPRHKPTASSLTATYDSPATKGKSIIESMTRKYRGKYVEFVGLSAKTMLPTLNLLSNIRYDFYANPDIQLVYLFDGRSVPQDYYDSFVARYLDAEDTHLLSADDFAAVREFLLSREPSVVGTLNRQGFPLVNPLNYYDEYEFRRRFRMVLRTESDLLTHEEQAMMDTMVEVPDSVSLLYDREHTYGAGEPLIPQHQAQAEHRMLHLTWWLVGILALVLLFLLYRFGRRKRRATSSVSYIPEEATATLSTPSDLSQETAATLSADAKKSSGDPFWRNLIAAWAAKKPKNAAFLAQLEEIQPPLTLREQAMCLILYSEDLTDEQVMQILEIPSPSAYRTAKSRLRKKLKNVESIDIKNLSL